MNKVALLVAACCAVVGLCGFGMGLNTCDSSEESIRHCIVVIFDRNKDGVITMDELERSFKDRVTYNSNLNATMVMRGGKKNSPPPPPPPAAAAVWLSLKKNTAPQSGAVFLLGSH